jgi:acetaldehyde dehydrogenase (acetylating)
MESSTIVAIVGSCAGLLSTLGVAYLAFKGEKLKVAVANSVKEQAKRTQDAKDYVIESKETVNGFKWLLTQYENRITKAEANATGALIELTNERKHREQCDIRVARLEAVMIIKGWLPDGWQKTEVDIFTKEDG